MGQEYYHKKTNWFLIFFVILLIIGLVFFLFYRFDILNTKAKTTEMMNKIKFWKSTTEETDVYQGQLQVIQAQAPPAEVSWCKIQDIPVSDSQLAPISMKYIGWDSQQEACIVEVTGQFECLNKSSVLEYAFTSNIGGTVVWAALDGYFISVPTDYKKIINKMHKALYSDYAGCECISRPAIYESKWILPEVEHSC